MFTRAAWTGRNAAKLVSLPIPGGRWFEPDPRYRVAKDKNTSEISYEIRGIFVAGDDTRVKQKWYVLTHRGSTPRRLYPATTSG